MASKPRIYIAITTFLPLVGGAETQTLAQAQRLLENGHDVQVVTFRHERSWARSEVIRGVPVLRVAGGLLGDREKYPRIVQRLLYFLAMFVISWTLLRHRKRYDVLQVCQCSLLVLPLALVCKVARKPMTIVLISAGSDKASKTSAAATLVAGPLDPATPWLQVDGQTWIDGDLYGLKSGGATVVALTRGLLKQIGAVMIVLSSRMLRYLKENDFDLPGTRLVPNGVDIVRFQPAPVELSDARHAQTVVCVSKLRYEKGIDVLLQAWRLVQEECPTARLVIVGSGPMEQQLKRLAAALTVTESVEFAGLQSDVPGQLHRGAIGILPSRWEGMPNALLEAMASGLACVATRVSGSEDVIRSGVNGLLVESEAYEAMAQALLTLLHDPALACQYGEAARATIEKQYTLEQVIGMYTDIYQSVIRNQRPTAGEVSHPSAAH